MSRAAALVLVLTAGVAGRALAADPDPFADVTFGPGPARAAATDLDEPRLGIELRTGPYQPRIGSGDARTYYERFYASGKNSSLFRYQPLMTELEVDWYLARSFGLLGPMLHVGMWSVSGKTRVCDIPQPGGGTKPGACTSDQIIAGESKPGNDTSTLSVFPLGLGLVYRFDLVKRSTPVPLVPYAKASLDYYVWRNTAAGDVSRNAAGHKAQGGTFGVRGTVGLALNLDFIEPSTASRARVTTGVTDTYLFFEASRIWADGFGDSRRLDFSDTLFQAGLAIDFE